MHLEATKLLKQDMTNAIWHVLGHHQECSADFCKVKQPVACTPGDQDVPADTSVTMSLPNSDVLTPTAVDGTVAPSLHDDTTPNTDHDTTVPVPVTVTDPDMADDEDIDTFLMQQNMWTEGTSEEEMEASRLDRPGGPAPIHKEIITAVIQLLQPAIQKADRLLGNFTSNLAESWMAIRTKFDGGKVVNRCQGASWANRCYGASLRRNMGIGWSPIAWQRVTGTKPSAAFVKHYEFRRRHYAAAMRSKAKQDVRERARKRKSAGNVQATSKKARQAYGPDCTIECPDVTATSLEQLTSNFLADSVHITVSRRKELEAQTRLQSHCELWKRERRMRLTASSISAVVKRNPTLKVNPLVRQLLHSTFRGTVHTARGLSEEKGSIQDYVAAKKDSGETVEIQPCGFLVHKVNHWLGATPDGRVTVQGRTVGLLEVKYLLNGKSKTFKEAAMPKPHGVTGFCLEEVDGKLQLRRNHPYYVQVQCQMEVWDQPWTDFVVRATKPNQLHIERVHRQPALWAQWLPKLHNFYLKALLPELAAPRYNMVPGIREPGLWVRMGSRSCVYMYSCGMKCSNY